MTERACIVVVDGWLGNVPDGATALAFLDSGDSHFGCRCPRVELGSPAFWQGCPCQDGQIGWNATRGPSDWGRLAWAAPSLRELASRSGAPRLWLCTGISSRTSTSRLASRHSGKTSCAGSTLCGGARSWPSWPPSVAEAPVSPAAKLKRIHAFCLISDVEHETRFSTSTAAIIAMHVSLSCMFHHKIKTVKQGIATFFNSKQQEVNHKTIKRINADAPFSS